MTQVRTIFRSFFVAMMLAAFAMPASARPVQFAITATASPAAGGTVTCNPNPVPYSGTSNCTATAGTGYHFTAFGGACNGTSCVLSNVTANKSVTANFALNTLTIASTNSSAAKGAPFPVTASLAGGPQDASVTLDATGCPAIDGAPASLTATASSGVATFNLTFTNIGSCTLTASSTPNYPTSNALNFVVYAIPDVGCTPADLATSEPTNAALLDPTADISYTLPGWGLRNLGNVGGTTCTPVNATLTTVDDPEGPLVANLVFDKVAIPTGNFVYVVVTGPRPIPADGWPTLRPQVAWNPVGPLEYIDGLACLSDDNSLPDSVVMPLIPQALESLPNYPANTRAKMCIAQVGWTPDVDNPGYIVYWVKVIDRSDSSVKLPR